MDKMLCYYKWTNRNVHGGGQVVSVLSFYSINLSSNPAEVSSFSSVKYVFEQYKNKQKEAGDGQFLKNK